MSDLAINAIIFLMLVTIGLLGYALTQALRLRKELSASAERHQELGTKPLEPPRSTGDSTIAGDFVRES